MTGPPEMLLQILEELGEDEFERFKWYMCQKRTLEDFPSIPKSQLEKANRIQTVDQIVHTYPENSIKVINIVLVKIRRKDLVLNDLSETSGSDGTVHRVDHGGEQRSKPDLMKYFCQLEVDTNSVNRYLKLSDNNRTVTCVEEEEQPYPDHPDRFNYWHQLLCRNVLTGRCYWEVEWRGGVNISVSYKRIRRKGGGYDCWFGANKQSWSLFCSHDGYAVWHNNRETSISSSSSGSGRVAVYVDCPAGTVSFYTVFSDTLFHLHTFSTTFTEPVHAGFLLCSSSSVSLSV